MEVAAVVEDNCRWDTKLNHSSMQRRTAMKRTWQTALGYVAKPVGGIGIAAIAVTLWLSGVPRDLGVDITLIDDVEAQQARGENPQQGGAGKAGGPAGGGPGGAGQHGGGQPGTALEDQVFRGKKAVEPAAEEDDSDSDRPDWAGGNPDLNPHRPSGVGRPEDPGQQPTDPGGGKPGDSGKPALVKGDEYGDLFVYVRDPVTGAPILTIEDDQDGDGNCDVGETCYYQVYVCEDPECTEIRIEKLNLVWDDGSEKWAAELPEGLTSLEVDFGRASSVRAPDRVTDHALEEVVKKLDAAASYDAEGNIIALNVTMDEAGRLVIADATVDSPLENSAIYIALLESDENALDPFVDKLLDTLNVSKLDLAASALAGSADKTGDITEDFVVYQNAIVDTVNSQTIIVADDSQTPGDQTITFDYYDYSGVAYDRTNYDHEVSYYYTPDEGATVLQSTVNLMDFLNLTNEVADIGTLDGLSLFSLQSDDSLQIIELIHTQIHDGLLPGDTSTAAPAVAGD